MESPEKKRGFSLLDQAKTLEELSGAKVEIDPGVFEKHSYVIQFNFNGAEVGVVASLDTSKRELLINGITVDEETAERGKGLGAKTVQALISLARQNNLSVFATKVFAVAQGFWERQGFVRCAEPNPNNTFEYRE